MENAKSKKSSKKSFKEQKAAAREAEKQRNKDRLNWALQEASPFIHLECSTDNFSIWYIKNQYYLIDQRSFEIVDKGRSLVTHSIPRIEHADQTYTLYDPENLKPYPHAENVYRCGVSNNGISYWVQQTRKDKTKTYLLPQTIARYAKNATIIGFLAIAGVLGIKGCTENNADLMKNNRQELRENPQNTSAGAKKVSASESLKQISQPQKEM